MHLNAILDEVQQLYNMSDRLDTLAEQHPVVSEALITISGSLRNTATLLEVLVVTKIAPLSGSDPQMPDLF
jgi:predicted AAA+ superfamily ATPase